MFCNACDFYRNACHMIPRHIASTKSSPLYALCIHVICHHIICWWQDGVLVQHREGKMSATTVQNCTHTVLTITKSVNVYWGIEWKLVICYLLQMRLSLSGLSERATTSKLTDRVENYPFLSSTSNVSFWKVVASLWMKGVGKMVWFRFQRQSYLWMAHGVAAATACRRVCTHP